ncbi:solute carrier organic anion transporter family member 2A1-like [Haliotis rufescens]|uniref:solute carrier organic anion transporter family member 2A1-like n=1 Tax=Haliotis rufescens TaxID=6454 RepID=UPI00201E86A7|nr:solute carrier organic anion transporter family member 2A1-like [Haliotis rufescens]
MNSAQDPVVGIPKTNIYKFFMRSRSVFEDKAGDEKNSPEDEDEEETQCGIGSCKPQACRPCGNLIAFTCTYSVVGILLQTLTTFLSSQITTLEKQFNFSSTISGMLLSSNDIGYLTAVLFFSHFGKHGHIPRILGATGMLFGFAGMFTCLANFIHPAHLPEEILNATNDYEIQFVCRESNTTISSSAAHEQATYDSGRSTLALWVIGIGMALQGVAKTTRTPLASFYLDNNVVNRAHTSIYIGALMTSMLFGPSVALVVGSALAKIPVDLQDTYLTPSDPRWIGAWWLGFIIFGGMGLLVSIPVFFFPRRIAGAPKYEIPDTETALGKIKDMPLSVLRALSRPVYTISIINSCLYGFAISGLISFGPKYIEYQFNIPAWKTSLILGISNLVTSAAGTFMGGVLTGRLNLSRQGCLKLMMVVHAVSFGLNCCGFILGCDNTPIEGVDFFRNDNETGRACFCSETPFLPVCGADHVTYSNPCQAGCWNHTGDVYGSCSRVEGMTATPGICDNGCNNLIPYIVTSVLMTMVATVAIMPHYMVYLRSVEERDKAMAMGITNFLATLLGWLPAPIVYGKVIDSACKILRGGSSHGNGACSLYDIVDLRYKVFGLEVSIKVVAFILLVISFIVCRWEDRKNESKGQAHNNVVLTKKISQHDGEKSSGNSTSGTSGKYDTH